MVLPGILQVGDAVCGQAGGTSRCGNRFPTLSDDRSFLGPNVIGGLSQFVWIKSPRLGESKHFRPEAGIGVELPTVRWDEDAVDIVHLIDQLTLDRLPVRLQQL